MLTAAGLKLPALDIAARVNSSLESCPRLVVSAPPGAGKSTVLPLAILDISGNGKVVMLEPRRIAARQIALRMASLLGEAVGETVGYRVRFETKVSERTRLEVVTEGILTRMLIDDPTLEGISALIFDEFHERSLNCDLALALSLECQKLVRPELRIVLMSATIDADSVCQVLDAPQICAQGRMYPVDIRCSDVVADEENVAQMVAHQIRISLRDDEGDILAFLPGEASIRRCEELLSTLEDVEIRPLYGMLSLEGQRLAMLPSSRRKVVLATPIAETSLTIEGVRIVIDSGLCRKLCHDPQTSLSHLTTVRISRDMATQRSGRAGRTAPGICYRLWNMATDSRMQDTRIPEILEADLCDMVLATAAWGESHPENLPWVTPPSAYSLKKAKETLSMLGAISPDGKITALGLKMASLPCHPRMARMLLSAGDDVSMSLACDMAAVLEDRDPLSKDVQSCDIALRVRALRLFRRNGTGKGFSRIEKAAAQYRAAVRAKVDNADPDPFEAGRLIASAYPERVAKEQTPGHYLLSCGDMATLDPADPVAHEWLAIASVSGASAGGGRIFLAAPVDARDLEEMAVERENVTWDSRKSCVVARREWRIGRLLLKSQPSSDIDRNMLESIVCEAVAKEGPALLDFSDEALSTVRRISCVRTWHPDAGLPELTLQSLAENCRDWLPAWLGKDVNRSELKKIDLSQVLWSLLLPEHQKLVARLAPTHIQVPSGSNIRLDYRQGSELPVLRVRLQECFGLRNTPAVDDGRVPVLMELLSPGFKPVQLTTDLASFWNGTYYEVRKELGRRYPKHSWPDDPLLAPPKRGVKK